MILYSGCWNDVLRGDNRSMVYVGPRNNDVKLLRDNVEERY